MSATKPPPIPWRVENFAVDGMLTMLAGREGQGKSMLGLGLAAGVAHGRTVAGLRCERGTVLVVDAENGEHEAHRRLHGLQVPSGALEYHLAEGFDLARDLAHFEALLTRFRPRFAVLDGMRSLWPAGDENDSGACESALGPLRGLLRGRNVAGLLLHHEGKGAGGFRGSTAIGAAVELGFRLGRVEGDPEAQTRRELRCWKCRPAPEPEVRWIALQATDEGPRVVQAAAGPTGTPTLKESLADEIAVVLAEADGPMQRKDIAATVGRDPKDSTVGEALKLLEATKRATQGEDKRWSA